MKSKSCQLLILLLAAGVLAGATSCTLHEVKQSAPPPVPVPPKFSDSGREPSPDRWWETFEDDQLNDLIRRALACNLDLRQAAARLAQARMIAVKAGADRWPRLSAQAGASRGRTFSTFDAARLDQIKSTDSLFSLTLAASYELDIWRRVRSRRDAALLDMAATREDLDAAAITLAATVGETWFSLTEQRAQLKLLNEQIKTSETFLELVELRFSEGQASALDVYQQRTQVAVTRGQLPAVESRLAVLKHQLAVLLGRPPLAEVTRARQPSGALPDLSPLPETGLPADLLKRRPDVRAAHARLVAADHLVAAAIADRLPALRLSAQSVYQATEPSEVFNNWIWTLAGNIVQPVFEGGRLKAEVYRARAAKKERLIAYGKTVLNAFREVEDALAEERHQRTLIANLEDQIRLATATLDQARDRYVNGMSDYLPVLTALQVVQGKERDLLRARRGLISFRIRLYRALGGSWPRKLRPLPWFVMSESGDVK